MKTNNAAAFATTDLECQMIDRIVHDLYQPSNGGEPESFDELSEIWAECLLESKADGGVISSLCQKGLATHSGYIAGRMNGRVRNEATVRLTQAGWNVYVERIKKVAAPTQSEIDAGIVKAALLDYAQRMTNEALAVEREFDTEQSRGLVKAKLALAARAKEMI
jgi:hypothetical protein